MTIPMQQCPKWDTCSAPVCPLDKGYRDCCTLKGEPVCLWLREGMKPGGEQRMPPAILPAVRKAIPILLREGGAVLREKLLKAAKSGSKITAGRARRPLSAAVAAEADRMPPETARALPEGYQQEAAA